MVEFAVWRIFTLHHNVPMPSSFISFFTECASTASGTLTVRSLVFVGSIAVSFQVVMHRVWLDPVTKWSRGLLCGRCFRALSCCDELATPMCPAVQFRTLCTSTVFVRRSLDLAVLISRSMVCGRMLGPMCNPWLDNTRHMTSNPTNIILTLDNYTGGSVSC